MQKKIRRLGVPSASKKQIKTSATYRTVRVTVPDAPVAEPLPSSMIFYVDTRFTAAQVTRIRTMISGVLVQWQAHFEAVDAGRRSAYQNCVNKYARFNLAPVWFEEKLSNGAAAASVQMDGFTTQIAANGFGRASKAYIMYEVPKAGKIFTIKGVNASDPEKNSLTVTINPKKISDKSITTANLAGSLSHAWLHREGYRHPAGKFTSYMAGESSMCIMRGNKDKVSGVPDKTRTQYLD